MAFDAQIADELRECLAGEDGLSEKRMFGGLAFLIDGKMAVAATSDGLMVRIDPSQVEELVSDGRAERMVMNGRPMNGWLSIDADAVPTHGEIARWAAIGVSYARSLPAK